MNVYNNVLELIGKTPLLRLNKIGSHFQSTLYAKLEMFNPGSSIKDRIGYNMIVQAEKDGLIKPGDHIVEPTSGNTGIGIALTGAIKGYKVTLTMPKSASIERRKIMKAFGANVVLIEEGGIKGAIAKANEIATQESGVYIPLQFKNQANPDIHKRTTAIEILDDLDEKVDVFISAIGTGGTITGVGQILKKICPNVKIVGIEPKKSPVLSGGEANPHKIQGMGAGFIPDVLNIDILDEIIQIEDEEAFEMARVLAKKEGIFAGISSGAAIAAALKYCENHDAEQNIVIIIPDTGERYISSQLWD